MEIMRCSACSQLRKAGLLHSPATVLGDNDAQQLPPATNILITPHHLARKAADEIAKQRSGAAFANNADVGHQQDDRGRSKDTAAPSAPSMEQATQVFTLGSSSFSCSGSGSYAHSGLNLNPGRPSSPTTCGAKRQMQSMRKGTIRATAFARDPIVGVVGRMHSSTSTAIKALRSCASAVSIAGSSLCNNLRR